MASFKKQQKSWFIPKPYRHLLGGFSVHDKQHIKAIVANPSLVAKHAFLPLLYKSIVVRRYKKTSKDGDKINNWKTEKLRPIHFPSHLDGFVYAYYCKEVLGPKYEEALQKEKGLSECATAYRTIPAEAGGSTNKSNIHFAKEIFDYIRSKETACYAMAFDVSDFFPTLNHKKLKSAWCSVLGTKSLPKDHYNIFKSATNFRYINVSAFRHKQRTKAGFDEARLSQNRKKGSNGFFATYQELRKAIDSKELTVFKKQKCNDNKEIIGIPQGLPISGLLANIYMMDFDRLMLNKMSEVGGLYRRYSDDIIVVCNPEHKDEIYRFVLDTIKLQFLEIKEEKTEICYFEPVSGTMRVFREEKDGTRHPNIPLLYLGFEFYGDKVLLKSNALAKFYRSMKAHIKRRTRKIKKLNMYSFPPRNILFLRKLKRRFTEMGTRGRQLPKKKLIYHKTHKGFDYEPELKPYLHQYKGNFLNYVYRASEIMEEPRIKAQLRKHRIIFWEYLRKKLG